MIGFLVRGRVRIKIRIRVRVRVGVGVTPPDAATSWRRPEALHYAIAWTYIASTHGQLNALTLELFSTTMSHISDFWLNYRGRLGCTYQTSAESVKFSLKVTSSEEPGKSP